MEKEIKILTNVFLNTSDNKVILTNIYFNDKIVKIENLLESELNWEQIGSYERRKQFIENFNIPKLSVNGKMINGDFNLVIPGAIDPHVHFDTPGFEFRDTFEDGTTAAAFGGVTTIIDMPCTSLPPVTNINNFEIKRNAVKDRALIDYAFWGGVCRNDFENFEDIEKNIIDLDEAGVASYKAYLISGMETFKDLNLDQMKLAAGLIRKTGKPLGVHAEDKFLVESRRLEFQSNNRNEWRHYCLSRDSLAEETAVKNMINISESTGAKIHVVHLSSQLGLDAIKEVQKRGINISTETCSHYLEFTQQDFENLEIRNKLKTAPPVKNVNDKNALWQGLVDGSINFITTDHAGCDPTQEKKSDNFWEVYGGIPGVEHRVPHIFSEGFLKQKLTLERTINIISTNIAEYFNLKDKGKIDINFDADFALLNLWESETVKEEKMHSKGKYTPFNGTTYDCVIKKTILRGNTVMDKDTDEEKSIGYGEFIEVH